MENRNEIEMKGDNELSIGRNMDQGQGFVCWLYVEMACYRLKDGNVLRETGRERKVFSSLSATAPFLDQARPCFGTPILTI